MPGGQNGWDHSGLSGKLEWHNNPEHIARTLDAIGNLSERYGHHPALLGLELLNEPSWEIPQAILIDYYEKGYQNIREHSGQSVSVIISDAFQPLKWGGVMVEPEYKSVLLDAHLFQAFSNEDQRMDLNGHLGKAGKEWSSLLDKVQVGHPLVVGEWSLGLPPAATKGLTADQKTAR